MSKKQIQTSDAPAAIGPYSQAIRSGNMVFVSGQVPINPETSKIESQDIADQTHQVMKNLHNVLAKAGVNFDHVVKAGIFLQDLNDFKVVNEIYGSYLKEPYPARATVQVARLPLDVKVEIDVVAVDG